VQKNTSPLLTPEALRADVSCSRRMEQAPVAANGNPQHSELGLAGLALEPSPRLCRIQLQANIPALREAWKNTRALRLWH
jgi:hypothetical protein